MPEVALSLPMSRRWATIKSPHQELFEKLCDGQVWRIGRDEYTGPTNTFRCSVQSWAKRRKMVAATRTDKEGNVWVQMKAIGVDADRSRQA